MRYVDGKSLSQAKSELAYSEIVSISHPFDSKLVRSDVDFVEAQQERQLRLVHDTGQW